MKNQLTLSVVSHGHGALLDRLLSQLNAQDVLRDARVVVTLNLRDEPFEAARYAHLDLTVLRNPQPQGFGANHNAAFRLCTTPYFCILNPDLRLAREEPFTTLLAIAATISNAGVVGPRVIAADGSPEDSVRANLTPWSLLGRAITGRRQPLDVSQPAQRGQGFYWLAGMFLLVDSRAFAEIGGFDERFFLYCEDYDLCARMFNAGYSIALGEDASIVHEAQRDSHRSRVHLQWHLSSLLKVWCSRAFWRVTLAT